MIILNILLYYLVILPISLLPFPVLYFISDGLYVLLYYVFGYRKKIVLTNLRNSFPQKSEEEIKLICKKFYHHFCDLVVESLKTFTISQEQVKKRIVCTNPEVINKYFEQGRSIILAGGHYNNWELFAVAVDDLIKHQSVALYLPLNNTFFDNLMKKTRGRYGLIMISTKKIKDFFQANENNLTALIFGMDQSPGNPAKSYWTTFLNQDTGVLFGPEKYAKLHNQPVVFGHLQKVKRGHYVLSFFDVTDKPLETANGEITEKLIRLIEKDIIAQPEYWLWTHRRWKHKRPAELLSA